MSLRNLLHDLLRNKTVTYTHFRLSPDRLAKVETFQQGGRFIPRQTYFEIRLSQMYLRDQREYWREFQPLASIMPEFIFAGERRTVPVVVGPERLERAQKVSKGDQVEYLNTRVAGPYPYEGDDLSLFVGLFRYVTNNWAKRALSLLETVVEAFDSSKLTSYLSIAVPLVNGLEGFLGMQGVEMRLGLQKAYATPPTGEIGAVGDNVLQPGFEVLIRAPSQGFDEAERRKFWIYEDRLFYGDRQDHLRPFDQADFMLLQIIPLDVRHDYTTFDFHKIYWPKVTEHVWNGDEDRARQALRLLAASLVQCQDITLPHRQMLLREYKHNFDDELARYKEMFDPEYLPRDLGRRSAAEAGPRPLIEADLQKALTASAVAPSQPQLSLRTPEELMAQLEV